jgi:hypothetical protein
METLWVKTSLDSLSILKRAELLSVVDVLRASPAEEGAMRKLCEQRLGHLKRDGSGVA